MARYTYSDKDITVNPKQQDKLFDSNAKYYLLGNAILTIKTGKMGWSQVIIRRATGAVIWVMHLRSKFEDT